MESIIKEVSFNDQGLIAAIAQDATTNEVLMMAWMNAEALTETLSTKQATYFSRSRQKLWRKGESSGQTQKLISAALDCDGDALLMKVEQTGVACHTGRKSCFYKGIDTGEVVELTQPETDPDQLYGKTS